MLFAMVALSILLQVMRVIENAPVGIGSLRVYLVIGLNIIHIILTRLGKFTLAKVTLVFFTPLVFLIVPTIAGFVEEESFFYYPVAAIAFSVVSQLVFALPKERVIYWTSIVYYFVLVAIIDVLLFLFASEELQALKLYVDMVVFYKSAYLAIFLFINFSVYYLKVLNVKYENELKGANADLKQKSRDLESQNVTLDSKIKELKNTQQQLIQSEKMASLGTLTAGIAHEINTPLNFINTGSLLIYNALNDQSEGNLEGDEFAKSISEAKGIIDDGIERTRYIVSSFMRFSYQGKSKKQLFELNQIVESSLRFLKQKMPINIILTKDLDLEQPVPMYVEKVHQIVLNLIDNALDAIEEATILRSPELTIRTEKIVDGSQTKARLSIYNSGSHIPEKIGAQIFDPFFTTKIVGKGTGLGLSTCYKLTKEHSGRLFYQNKDKGVVFILDLPLENSL